METSKLDNELFRKKNVRMKVDTNNTDKWEFCNGTDWSKLNDQIVTNWEQNGHWEISFYNNNESHLDHSNELLIGTDLKRSIKKN